MFYLQRIEFLAMKESNITILEKFFIFTKFCLFNWLCDYWILFESKVTNQNWEK